MDVARAPAVLHRESKYRRCRNKANIWSIALRRFNKDKDVKDVDRWIFTFLLRVDLSEKELHTTLLNYNLQLKSKHRIFLIEINRVKEDRFGIAKIRILIQRKKICYQRVNKFYLLMLSTGTTRRRDKV